MTGIERTAPTTIIARWLTPRVGQDPTQAARELVEELRREGLVIERRRTEPITYDTKIQNNDPRMNGRILMVTGFEGDYVFAKVRSGLSGKLTRIRRDRIHTDGRPRKSGWSVVPAPDDADARGGA